MENEPSLLDVADEEFAKINKPEQKQEQGSLLDIADDEFNKQEEESTQKEFDVAKLEKLKAEGKPLSEAQERMIFDEKDKVPLLEQTAIGLEKFIPAAAVKVGQLARGAYELAREGVVKPVYVGTKYHLGLATPKETNIAARGAEIAGRSAVSGVMSDLEDTAGTIIKGYESGSAFTDKLQGLSADERFKRYRWRETFSGYEQARREETPDRAAAILAENVLLQKAAGIAAKLQGGTEEDAKEAEKAYSELVLESGLTREELNPYISSLGEVISPISIPGANIATKTIGKYTGKAVQKGGELALKKLVKPVATGVEKSAEFVEKGITGVQTGARKLGEYVTGDPDTLIRGGSIAGLIQAPQITGMILAAKPATIATKEIARTVKDIASAVDVGGAAGIRGLVERGGAKPNAGALTKRLFSAESRGGLGRARAADWMIRQGNAIAQQGVNGAVLNTILGLPDIESIEQGFEAAGSGFGIGAFTGSRIMERAGAVIDPRTGLAQKIDTIITPDPSSRRADEDADIKRFLSSVDPDLVPKMEKLGSIDERKKAIQSKVDALEKQKNVTFGPEVELIKKEIIRQKQNIEKLDKSTPQTQKEILRQIHLAFADEMDLAKTTGKAAGLNNIQVKILDPSEMEGFYRNSYGTTLTDAESVVASLTGKPDLTPEETQSLKNARTVVDGFFREVAGSQSTRGFAVSEGSDSDGNPLPEFMRKQNLQGATIVINGDLVKQLSDEGFNIRNVVGHEMQHALGRFTEVRDMLAPIRKDLFDQKTIEPDGTVKKITSGIYSDDQLDSYADVYAASMSPSDGGNSFKKQFGDDKEKLRAYIKEEVLSEISGRSGNVNAGTRAALDSIGRQAVDWLEVKTQNGALKKIKETLRKSGIIFDENGTVSTILGAELTPESLAMIRQYKRQLKNLNQSMVYETGTRKEEVDVPIERIMADRSLQEKTKDIDLFQKEQVAVVTAPDGSKQEIPIPPDTGVDSFVGKYNIQEGQLVDESGSPINLGPIEFGTVPNGTQVEIQSVISRDSDGVPKALTLRKAEQLSRERGKTIKDALDSAMQKGALQMEDMGNGHYRGTMSEAQVSAILALPNTIVSPELKREILFVNEILRRRDGTRIRFEYFPTTKGGKPNSISMQIRDEIPIGFHFSKKFNFFKTTISVTRMMEKLNAWVAKNPENLKLWNGDTSSFWDDLTKVLANHASGERGEYQLDDDVSVAIEKKNAINDLFNVYNAETKAANPRRTKLPRQKGKDPLDIIVRSRRMDRIGQYIESDEQKLPFNYELNTRNYMPAENPLAGFQTPEDFASDIPSVTAEEIRGAINTGNLNQVEAKLRESDDLKPAESLDEQNGNIRIVSMFDNQFMPEEPMESEPEVSASATQFMPAETERYPTSERGMYSGLQKTIDEKVQGKFASPDQLKAIVTNPQNAKAEELKWSGVLGEIDRLAAENNGKVPKDKVMDYLRNEGAVKFEEVTLGGKEAFDQNRLNQLEAEYRNLKDHPIDDPSFGEDKYDELIKLMNIRDQSTTDTLYSEAERVMALAQQAQRRGDKKTAEKYFRENEFLNTRAEKLDLQGQGLANPPRFAGLQLPGGANYREVVMTMPVKQNKPPFKQWFEEMNLGSFDDLNENQKNRLFDQYENEIDPTIPTYTSSHFPDTPNYVAHMRLNERTDAQGNEGLFVEEFQSDRHQAGREKGYQEPLTQEQTERREFLRSRSMLMESEGVELGDLNRIALGGVWDERTPDAPFRKDWSIQLFKRALRDAVDSDKKWIGWTTGIEQVKRYEQAMRQAVDEITWNTPKGYQKSFSAIKNGNTVLAGKINDDGSVYDSDTADANGKQLSEVVGKEVASKILAENSGTATGDDLTVGGEGMKGFYDQILPKEVGKYVGKMGGKVEKSEIGQEITEDDLDMGDLSDATPQELAELEATGKVVGNTVPIWRVDITPEMAGKVRAGQLQFMPADSDYLNLAKDPEKNREQLQRMVDEAANRAGYDDNKGKYWWHGSKIKNLTEFDITMRGSATDFGALGSGFYFSPTKGVAEKYVGKTKSSYPIPDGSLIKSFLKMENPATATQAQVEMSRLKGDGDFTQEVSDKTRQSLLDKGYDSVIGDEFFEEVVVLTPSQIKSADPVTYDDAGNVIPLSQRFNKKTPDIRFMPAEQPTEYEPISARIRPLEGISAPTKMVGAKALSLGEIEPPVRGKAMLPDMELKPDISEKGIQSSDIITSAKPAPDAVIKPFSNALVSSAGLINFLPAWHGTPHEVDKFKLEKIGTGEGAQAYGWGLYFGQARSVGEKYKENLSEYKATLDGRKVAPETLYVTFGPKYPGYLDGVINSQGLIERWLRQPNTQNPYPDGSQRSNLWNEVSSRAKSEGKGGNLYKVDLDVKDEDLLDWDNPLSEQSEKIQTAIKSIDRFSDVRLDNTGKDIYEVLSNKPWIAAQLNADWQKNNPYQPKIASEKLLEAGIPGIRYLDGMSRTSASDINRRDELLKEGAQLRKTLENNPKDWEMRKQFKDWLTASEQELAALEKQIKSAETSPTHNYVIFDENLITILDKNDKPVQGELPRATGLQFMPASPVTKTQTGYDYTYLDEALKNGKNGKVALTRPVRADEALPLLSQRIPITNQVDRNSFDYLSPAEVEFYQYENNPVSFKFDPALLKKPVFKDAAVEHAGKNVQLAMADRQTTTGGDMGGILYSWLKSNIDSTVIGDDGIEYRAVWGNQEWKPVLSMKNKNKKFNSYNLLTYLMGPDAHASNTREVRIISNEIENANISRKQKDLFLMLANIGVKNQKRADQRDNINEANKDIDKTKKLIEDSSDPQEIKKLNKSIKQRENDIVLANIKYNEFLENPNEELIKSIIKNYKASYTRFKNKTGSESNFIKNKKALDDFKKTASFKDLLKTIKNKQLISLDDTFKGRKASIAQILGLTIDDFNVDNILDQTMDFKNGRINHIVGSIELSRNPDLMAVYLGDDPDQAKRMTAQESKAAAQLKANPNFVPHEAYAWAMLGPVNGNHFLNSNPKTHLEYFPDFKEAYASIQESEDKKQKIREGNETTLMGAMRDNTQMALAMPAISDKK